MRRKRWQTRTIATVAAATLGIALPLFVAEPAGAVITVDEVSAVRDCANAALITGTLVVTVTAPDAVEDIETASLYVRGPADGDWVLATSTTETTTNVVEVTYEVVMPEGVAFFAPVDIALFADGADPETDPPLQMVTNLALGGDGCAQRIFGQDAIDTSIAIAQASFTEPDSAGAVLLARSDWFSDALAGGPLAAQENAPLLITPGAPQRNTLEPRVLTEINRLLPPGGQVIVLGGSLAIASGVVDQLNTLGYDVDRVFGSNQFATAVAIADALGNPGVIFEATGLFFADALSAVPAAIEEGGAILLTNGPQQSPETAAYLAAHQGVVRYAIGGPLAAAGADPTAVPVWGDNQYGTSAKVADFFFDDPPMIGLATGRDYPDALGGGVFMATGDHRGPMVLVDRSLPIPPPVAQYLDGLESLQVVFVFGGPVAIENAVVAAVLSLGTS
jgi:putative cell wall-binding protein